MNHINIESLDYTYPNVEKSSLKDINLSIEKGEFVLIIGKSGSGKSTLAKCIAGTIPNFYGGTLKGKLEIEGIGYIDKRSSNQLRSISMVFQDPERQLVMNKVHREIAFGLENLGLSTEEINRRVWETLQFCNLLDLAKRDIKTLSGGQKQKVAIASALAMMDDCIILDEPISQLDPSSAEEIINLTKKINEELGITVIVIEQRIEKWLELSDKVIFMKNGAIDFNGEPKDFYGSSYYSFMPSYIKVLKYMKIESYPKNFKDARVLIENKFGLIDIKEDNLYYEKQEKRIPKGILKRIFSKEEKEQYEISIQEMKVFYKDYLALKSINLDIKQGDFCCLLGPNGAGKSTLFKAIMNLTEYKGTIKFQGKEIKSWDKRDLYKSIAYVSQNPNDYISKDTVYNEIKFTLDNYGISNEEKIKEIMISLNLTHLKDKNPRDISGGERQRLAIATMLVLEPKVILLDEPTRGLDNENKENLSRILKHINESGITIILITHDMDFAASCGRNFLLLFNGELISKGSLQQAFKEGFYYTTTVHKLFTNVQKNIFNIEDVKNIYQNSLRREL